jgi:predicted RNA-binding protein YlqC (UPF0109 family)
MEELVKYIVSQLVLHPEDVVVTMKEESEKINVITVKTNPEDLGRVIGKNGKIATSIRTIVKSKSSKMRKRYIVKFEEVQE